MVAVNDEAELSFERIDKGYVSRVFKAFLSRLDPADLPMMSVFVTGARLPTTAWEVHIIIDL